MPADAIAEDAIPEDAIPDDATPEDNTRSDVLPAGPTAPPNTAALWPMTFPAGWSWPLVDRIITLRGIQNRSRHAQQRLFIAVASSRFDVAV